MGANIGYGPTAERHSPRVAVAWGRKGVLGTHSVVDGARVGEAGMGRRACLAGVYAWLNCAQLRAEEVDCAPVAPPLILVFLFSF